MRKSLALLAATVAACTLRAGEAEQTLLRIFFPQERAVFATNEYIHLSIMRRSEAAAAGTLTLTLSGPQTGKITCEFTLNASPAGRVEHFFLNGFLLRPGQYTLQAKIGEQTASADFTVCSHSVSYTHLTLPTIYSV